jgi:hypothetical protein
MQRILLILLLHSAFCLLPSSAQPVLRGPLTTNSPAIKSAGTNGHIDALTNNLFRVPVGVSTNLVITNLAVGQVIRIDLFVTNGFTVTFPQQTDTNTIQGWLAPVRSNDWQTVIVSRPSSTETNFDIRAADFIATAGVTMSLDTNFATRAVTIRGATLSSNGVTVGAFSNLNVVATGGTNSLVQIGVTNGNATLQINATPPASAGSSNYPVIAVGTLDNTNLARMGNVNVGSNLTASSLQVTNPASLGDTNAAAPVLPDTVLRMLSVDAKPARFALESYNAADVNGSFITGYRIRGTKASPGVVVSNDVLLALSGNGWQGTMWTNSNALIAMKAETNFTAQNQPTFIQFFTTKRGTTNAVEALRIQPDGTTRATNLVQTPPELSGANGGPEAGVAYRLFSLTNSVTVTNTTSATSLITNALWGSQVIKAGTLKPGMNVRLRLRGFMTSASATVTTIGVRFNNGLVGATNIIAFATSLVSDHFGMDLVVSVRSSGASGTTFPYGEVLYQTGTGGSGITGPRRLQNGATASVITLDTTVDQVIDAYVAPGATTHGFTVTQAIAEIIP